MGVNTIIRVLLIVLGAVLVNSAVRSAFRVLCLRARDKAVLRKVALLIDRASSIFFASIAVVMILDALTIDIRPLLAGAGIVGLVVTFGAQAVLKDVFAGLFIFLENLYEEGDAVSLNDITGRVARLTLRKTVIRDKLGRLHHIPHGSVNIITVAPKKRNIA